MCVKEFYGYNCGHCSVPILRQCPLSASNSHFPVCKYPAERPVFTNEFCHPCARIVWNSKVLKEEEMHRVQHLRGECMCEVVFDGEERVKHHRTRGGKGRGKGKENTRQEQHGDSEVASHGIYEPGLMKGEPGGYNVGVRDAEEHGDMESNMQMMKIDGDGSEGSREPQQQLAAIGYEYSGYYIGSGREQGTDPGQSYSMAVNGGQGSQLPMGEIGAGMRWFPTQQNTPQSYYSFPQLSQPPKSAAHRYTMEGVPKGPRAASKLPNVHDRPGRSQHKEFRALQQPLVVSSDMMRPKST